MSAQLLDAQLREAAMTDAAVREVLDSHLAGEFSALPDDVASGIVELQSRARLGAFATGRPGAVAWVIEEPGHPLAYALVDETADALHLVDLVVRPAARRLGIATSLLDEFTHRADAAGRPAALSVAPGSDAERLYRRHGFTNTGGDGMHLAMRRPAMRGTR